jgi:hypothetical protein
MPQRGRKCSKAPKFSVFGDSCQRGEIIFSPKQKDHTTISKFSQMFVFQLVFKELLN